jgi:hypothetical protein
MQHRTKSTIVAIALAALVTSVSMIATASAGGGPTLSTTSPPTLNTGDPINITGTGCPPNSTATVGYVENVGTADENVFHTDYPVVVDGTGAFASSSTVPDTAKPGSTLRVFAKCGSPVDDVAQSSLTFSIAAAATTTTTAPSTTTTAPAAQSPGAVEAAPTFTG